MLLALAPVGMCQTTPVQKEEPVPSETIDEITVYGDKSLQVLRQELYKAEDNAYNVFNLLNSDDEYDIHCYREAPVGSHITRRVCRPNFVNDATADTARNWQLGLPYKDPGVVIQEKNKLLREEMEALVVKHPELFKALDEFSHAKQILETERQRRCEDRIVICQR